MTDVQICIAALVFLPVLLLLRFPVAVALGLVSIGGIAAIFGWKIALGVLTAIPHEVIASWTLTSVPMFLFMGFICHHANLTDGLFDAARVWLSKLPGGLAVATIGAGAGFSAVTASSVACAATLGRIATPAMLKQGYDPKIAAGTSAAAGTIGSMIPPSILLLLYGIYVEVPIGPLFLAGFLPGLLTAAMFSAVIIFAALIKPQLAPRVLNQVTWSERFAALGRIWPTLLLIIGVFGGLFSGFFTATEAGAVGAFLSLVIAAGMRTLNMRTLLAAFRETLLTTASIFVIAISANLLTRLLALGGFTDWLSSAVVGEGLGQFQILLIVAVVCILLGMFLDSLGIMLLTLPIFLPMLEGASIDLIWFGIIMVKLLEIGLLTPPVGLNVFVVKGVLKDVVSTQAIFLGVTWFILADLVTLTLLMLFPQIALFLPSLLR